jgi:acetylornithine deacetylase
LRDQLRGHGVESTLVYDKTREKANLYATLGPDDRGGIALSGHTDVVPIDGQNWASDPWQAKERDGRIYGRGTADMKSFIAVVMAFVPRFLARDLKTPIHLCFSFDEEIGCVGVRELLGFLRDQPVRPRGVIIGEPTEMRVINAHKGKFSMRCKVRGHECHSSLTPHGVNAIQEAAKLVVKLTEMAKRKATEGPFDEQYDVPYTTIHTGLIHGGTALNIVPADCGFDFEFRYLPAEDAEALFRELRDYAELDLLPAMQAVAPETGFTWEALASFPGLETPENAEIVGLAKSLAGANATGKVAFGTEAGLFGEQGMPAVVCGPGSIDQAHKPDEFVSLEQIALCERFMERLVERVQAA